MHLSMNIFYIERDCHISMLLLYFIVGRFVLFMTDVYPVILMKNGKNFNFNAITYLYIFKLSSCMTLMPATCVQNTRVHLFSYSCAYISIPLTTTNAALFNLCIFMKSYNFFNTGAAVFSGRFYQVRQCNNGS